MSLHPLTPMMSTLHKFLTIALLLYFGSKSRSLMFKNCCLKNSSQARKSCWKMVQLFQKMWLVTQVLTFWMYGIKIRFLNVPTLVQCGQLSLLWPAVTQVRRPRAEWHWQCESAYESLLVNVKSCQVCSTQQEIFGWNQSNERKKKYPFWTL